MSTLWHDLRFALRALTRTPGFAIVTVLTLALGIGATTGVFSAMYAVWLRSLPYPEPNQLVFVRSALKGRPIGLSAHDFLDYRDQATGFESFGAQLEFAVSMPSTGGDRPESVSATYVSTELFRTLGVAPAVGRSFTAEEGKPAPVAAPGEDEPLPPVAIISHAFWKRRFAASASVVGSALVLRGKPVTVVGVMPEGFRFFVDADLWLPLRLNGERAAVRRFHNWVAVGRLRPGVTLEQARGELSAIAQRLEAAYPDSNTGLGVQVFELHDALVSRLRPQVVLLSVAVALMLLIACGNVANLLLARGITRRGEIAMRVALGASRWRLVCQLLTESTALAVLGGLFGLGVAAVLQRVLPAVLSVQGGGHAIALLRLDPTVLAFATGVSLLTGVAVGVVPALRATRVSLFEELKGATRTATPRSGARLRLVLAAAQVSLALVLLIGSALLMRSFARLAQVNLGFDPERVLTASLSLPSTTSSGECAQVFASVLDELRAVGGVSDAAMVSRVPIVHPWGSTSVCAPESSGDCSAAQQALGRIVLPGYFQTMRMPILAGRDVLPTDRPGTSPVVVISENLARALFSDEAPIGRSLQVDTGGDRRTGFEVVGVVADARLNQLDARPSMVMYLPFEQAPTSSMHVVVRTSTDPQAVTGSLREIVWRRNKDVPVAELMTLEGAIRRSTGTQQMLAGTVTSFSLLALLLAAIGLFGVLAYQVTERQHELGIRMALGAGRPHVLAAVLRQGLAATAVGLLVGIVASLALTRLMAGALYEVAPTDPTSFVLAAACLIVVALIACLVPALRALAVQPVRALRYE